MNRLAHSTSPYLLQHADNPVDWHPWGEQAIQQARIEDKPIFLSVGYAACHWCHVMAHESFENQETAEFMNRHFINIKVDREERPDIDGIYMQAVVAMTGSGGWPMSVFLGHDLGPFYGGTYFPPFRKFNLPSFIDVLTGISNAWKNDRGELLKVGEKIQIHLEQSTTSSTSGTLTRQQFNSIAAKLQSTYDWGYGGWGDAPKFPQPMVAEFLLQHFLLESNEELKRLIKHYLQAMARGGLYDVVGGGFSRYSTDRSWRIPHFEKMLYNNALLTRLYLHAWQVLKEPQFRRVVEETLGFVMREMTNEEGGFFSSLDADSEGQEGKFYAWTLEELRSALGSDSELLEAAYGVSSSGNWEGKTILQRALDDASLAAHFKLDLATVSEIIGRSHARLLTARSLRVRPSTDDKVVTAWNGLMVAAFAEAARVFSNHSYLQSATRNAEFLLSKLRLQGSLRRSWRMGSATSEVFLEDHAALILGLLDLYQTDFDNQWFIAACELADEMVVRFSDPRGGFFDTAQDQKLLLYRPKDLQDNATPSGNSLACEALLKLAAFTGREDYRDLAENAGKSASSLVARYPLGFGRWLSALEFASQPVKQVAILGDRADQSFRSLVHIYRGSYRPFSIVAASTLPPPVSGPMVLIGRPLINGNSTAYVCESFVCKQPTTDPVIFQSQLDAQQ